MLVTTVAKNFVQNPTFASSSSQFWVDGSPAPISYFLDTAHVRTGTHALLINWANVTNGGIVQTELFGLTIGRQYTASAYVWVPTGDPAVRMQIDGGTAVGALSTLNNTFQRITLTWTATKASYLLQFTTATALPVAGDQVWVDDVQVEEGASATTFDSAEAVVHSRFYGMVNEWPLDWEGLYATTTVTCTDLFKWLSRQPTLQPMLVQEILLDEPSAYYPLSEPDTSTSAGDLSGTGAGPLVITQAGAGGTLAFGGADGPPADGLTCVTVTPSTATAGKYMVADLGADFMDSSGTPFTYTYVEAWFSTSTASRTLLALRSTDGQYVLTLGLNASGFITVTGVADGSVLTSQTVGAANLADGKMHHVTYGQQTDAVYVDGVLVGNATLIPAMADLRYLHVGGNNGAGLWSGTIAHVAAYPAHVLASSELSDHYEAGVDGYTGETADVRMARLASYAGVDSVTIVGSTFDPVASQGEGGQTAREMMRTVEATEGGKLFAERDFFGFAFQSRDVRYNPDPSTETFTVSYPDLERDSVHFDDDDQKLVNIVIASRPGGATQRFKNDHSLVAYGPYEQQLDIIKTTDNKVADAANWILSRFADPESEVREVSIDAYSLARADYRAILDAGISSFFTVTNLPSQAPSSEITCVVEGYTETIKQASHVLGFHCSRADTDSVWVLDDTTYSVLGSTTRLAY